jgi:pimeloyl-ACP methyl ester carboxylesterase
MAVSLTQNFSPAYRQKQTDAKLCSVFSNHKREQPLRIANILLLCAAAFLFTSSIKSLASFKSGLSYQKHAFVSQIDGSDDTYALSVPNSASGQDATLLVFLHGLNQDCTEPFKVPPGLTIAQGLVKEYPHLTILSCNYGKTPSWGTKSAREDITNNIHEVLVSHPVNRIVLAGDSMGACSALLYACLAPKDIGEKITGIIAAYPSADLEELHKTTEAPLVKSTMETALGKKPEEDATVYRQNSLEAHLPLFPRRAKVGIISASANTVFPTKLQADVVRLLKNRDIPVKMIEIEGNLQTPPVKSMVEAMQFVMQ